jgi:hypothetical protein
MLREELQQLHEPGSYVGEVVKVMSKTKVLVKARPARQQRRAASWLSLLRVRAGGYRRLRVSGHLTRPRPPPWGPRCTRRAST